MNIRQLLESNDISIAPHEHHHSRAGWINVDCPKCSPNSGRFLLGISEITCGTNCYQCGPHPSTQMIALLRGSSVSETYQMLKRLDRIHTERPVHTGHYQPPVGIGPLLRPHRDYLRSRGFKPSDLEALWGLRGLGVAGIMSWRIFIPIYWHGKPVSWLTRSLSDRAQRYISAQDDQSAIPRRETLYGADFCRSAIVVTEGPADVWKIGQGAVAICGLSFTSAQTAIIAQYPVRAICFDAEPEAQKRAKALADAVSIFPGTTHVIELEGGKDAGDTNKKEIKAIRKHFLKG